jgi:hypothetical protein
MNWNPSQSNHPKNGKEFNTARRACKAISPQFKAVEGVGRNTV